jgi:Flp pilus assembly pilin Flp
MVLGILFGKKVILAGVTGVLISLIAVVLIHYMPEIVLSVKGAAGSAISP